MSTLVVQKALKLNLKVVHGTKQYQKTDLQTSPRSETNRKENARLNRVGTQAAELWGQSVHCISSKVCLNFLLFTEKSCRVFAKKTKVHRNNFLFVLHTFFKLSTKQTIYNHYKCIPKVERMNRSFIIQCHVTYLRNSLDIWGNMIIYFLVEMKSLIPLSHL